MLYLLNESYIVCDISLSLAKASKLVIAMSSEPLEVCYRMFKDDDMTDHLEELVDLKRRLANAIKVSPIQQVYVPDRVALEIADICDTLQVKIEQMRQLQSECDTMVVNEIGSSS